MPTDVFHIDANGVRISADRAVFGEHAYATRNIRSIVTVTDKGVRWPGMTMLFIGFGLVAAGLVIGHTITLMFGAVAILSGSLNLGRKRSKYGVRIVTQRGPVYVLASQDKPYVEIVSAALRKAVDASSRRREAAASKTAAPGDDDPAAAPDPSRPRSGGPRPGGDSPAPRPRGQPARFRRRRR